MIEIIETESGAIGYSDAGAALDKELDEVALKVEKSNLKDDFFLTSKNALSKDGIAAALDAEGTNIPESGDVDWSGVDTINQVEVSLSSASPQFSWMRNRPFNIFASRLVCCM